MAGRCCSAPRYRRIADVSQGDRSGVSGEARDRLTAVGRSVVNAVARRARPMPRPRHGLRAASSLITAPRSSAAGTLRAPAPAGAAHSRRDRRAARRSPLDGEELGAVRAHPLAGLRRRRPAPPRAAAGVGAVLRVVRGADPRKAAAARRQEVVQPALLPGRLQQP